MHSVTLVHHHVSIRVDQGHELLEGLDELPAQRRQGVFDRESIPMRGYALSHARTPSRQHSC